MDGGCGEEQTQTQTAQSGDKCCFAEIQRHKAAYLFSHALRRRPAGGEKPDRQPYEQGGKQPLQELSQNIARHGQIAAADEGQDLTVYGQARPAQHEGRHGHGGRELGGYVLESPHTGAELYETGQQPQRSFVVNAQRRQEEAQKPGQEGQRSGEGQQLYYHGEKHHEAADVQAG